MEGQLLSLTVLNELLSKLPDVFGEQFTRLGLYMHIANLAVSPTCKSDVKAEGAGEIESENDAVAASKLEQTEVVSSCKVNFLVGLYT